MLKFFAIILLTMKKRNPNFQKLDRRSTSDLQGALEFTKMGKVIKMVGEFWETPKMTMEGEFKEAAPAYLVQIKIV